MKWNPFPMVRIAAFFIAGILLAVYLPNHIPFQWMLFTGAGFAVIYFASFFLLTHQGGTWLGIVGLGAVLCGGYIRLHLFDQSQAEDHLLRVTRQVEAYQALVRSVPEAKARSWKVEVELTTVKTGTWHPVKTKMLLYVADVTQPLNWQYGDQVLVKGAPSEIKPPANPGEFDFKRYLRFRNVFHQQFVQRQEVKWMGRGEPRSFIYYSQQARAWSLKKINQFVLGRQEQAIAAALVLGVTDGVDNDLQNAYAASGAMHVLAVSGLHVGIIYSLLLFLLKPWQAYSGSRWWMAALSLVLLWSFAFVTGLSPSVLRAVTMFSGIAIARPLGWRTNIYNILAASAFVLLLYNPCLVMSVGFQLSYLAVLGIVYLQRPLYHWWEIDNRVGDWIWQITCVSIAAQVATFSLGLLYFHQFPVYFLISNLFVIPLSTLVLVIGIVLLVISFASPVAHAVGVMLEWVIKALNWIVFQTEDLPFSLINHIYLNTFQCWLLIILLLSLLLLFERRRIGWLYTAVFISMMLVITQWIHFRSDVKQDRWVAYAISKHHALEFTRQGQSYFLSDSLLLTDRERIRFHIQPNRLLHGVTSVYSQIPFHRDTLGVKYFLWNDHLIGLIENKTFRLPSNVRFDYLVIAHPSISIDQFNPASANRVVLGADYSARLSQEGMAQKNGRYVVLSEEAFVMEE
jgi:competence protein ComEC